MSARAYEDACGVAAALDVVGERWALLVVRELLLGPRRFADLQQDLPGISPNVLSHRLASLTDSGVLRRVEIVHPVPAKMYEVTDRGRGLRQALIELGRWGSELGDRGGGFSASSMVLSILAALSTSSTQLPLALELQVGDQPFAIAVGPDVVDARRGPLPDSQAQVSGAHSTFEELIRGRERVGAAARSGLLTIAGPPALRTRALDLLKAALEPAA